MSEELNEELATRMGAAYVKGQEDRITVGLAQRDHLASAKTHPVVEADWAATQVQAGDDFSAILDRLNEQSYARPEAAHADLTSAAYIMGRWEGIDSHVTRLGQDLDYAIAYYEMRDHEIGGSLVALNSVKERVEEEPFQPRSTPGYQQATVAGIDFQRDQLRRLTARPSLTTEAQAAVALARSDHPKRSPQAVVAGQGTIANAHVRPAQGEAVERGSGR